MIVFMLVVLTMVFLVAVVAWLAPLAFRIIFNRTLKICLKFLCCLQFLWFVIGLYLLALSGKGCLSLW